MRRRKNWLQADTGNVGRSGLPVRCQETDLALISRPWMAVETGTSLKSKGKLPGPEAGKSWEARNGMRYPLAEQGCS